MVFWAKNRFYVKPRQTALATYPWDLTWPCSTSRKSIFWGLLGAFLGLKFSKMTPFHLEIIEKWSFLAILWPIFAQNCQFFVFLAQIAIRHLKSNEIYTWKIENKKVDFWGTDGQKTKSTTFWAIFATVRPRQPQVALWDWIWSQGRFRWRKRS